MNKHVGGPDYVWAEAPERGLVREVVPGILWARLPLPFRLDHVNVWLIEEDGAWTVIDAGCRTADMLAVWPVLEAGPMRGLPIRNVVATHGHVDHVGLAGWLVERHRADFVSTFAEWNWARVMHMLDAPDAARALRDHLARNGVGGDVADHMLESRRRFIGLSTPLPGAIIEIRDRSKYRMGGRDWDVIITRGHSNEHASFYNRELNVLIAGDHLLPRVSPVIAVYETMPRADPLADYLASFRRFARMPADVLVLPSHGLPYRGIHERISALKSHHAERLAETIEHADAPRTAAELTRRLFPRASGVDDFGFALGETLAHVNYLVGRKRLARRVTSNNVDHYGPL